MKLVQVHVHYEYADVVEALLDQHGVADFVRYPQVDGKDPSGKHFGTQVFPGNVTVVQALVPDERVDPLFADLDRFRREKRAHHHVQALAVPIERRLRDDSAEAG